jgi:hemolysin activation/secretion protein
MKFINKERRKTIFHLPSSLFFIPSSLFFVPSSLFLLPSSALSQTPPSVDKLPPNPGQLIRPEPIPSPPQPQPELQPQPPQLPSPEELLREQNVTPNQEILPGDIPQKITVQGFKFDGATVFTQEKLLEVVKAALKIDKLPAELTFTQVIQARAAVVDFYIKEGYITSGAFIPIEQKIPPAGGVVTIRVVEGSLENIEVVGTRRLDPDYIRDRIIINAGKPLNRQRLIQALQLLQLDPLIKTLSAELSAGSTPGQALLRVRVTEAKTLNTQLAIDNARSPSVGSFRRRVQLNQGNLTGRGDGLNLAYSNTDGSNSWDASYTLPINPRNGTLSLALGIATAKVIESPFSILDINSNSRYGELTWRQPLEQTPSKEFAVGVTLTRRTTEATFIEELRAPFPSPGADEDGITNLTALRFFQEWSQRSGEQVLAFRSQFNLGLGIFGATINDEPPDSSFISWRGQAQWVRLLRGDTLLLLRGDVQFANETLLPIEQFSLGGQNTVRGYRQDAVLTDNGILASAEIRFPLIRNPSQPVLQLIPFVDFGTSWNSSGGTKPNPSTLASVGLGLQYQSDNLTARLDWGIPLVDVNRTGDSWQEKGVYFSVVYNRF